MKKGFWGLAGALALMVAMLATLAACTKSEDTLVPGSEEWRNVENNYWHYCASCHGRDGKGNGMMASTSPIKPRNHTDPEVMGKHSDDALFKIISEGGESAGLDPSMPPHKTLLNENEMRQLVKYIRKLCNCSYASR